MEIQPVKKDSAIYNAVDATGHERGVTINHGKHIKNSCKRIYSVYAIVDGVAHCQSWDCWGKLFEESFPVNTLEHHPHERRRSGL